MIKQNQHRHRWFSENPIPSNDNSSYFQKCLVSILVFGVILFGYIVQTAAQLTFDKYDLPLGSAARQTVLTGFLRGGTVAEIAVIHIDRNNVRHLHIYAFDNRQWISKLDVSLRPGVLFVDIANIGGKDRLITYERGRLNWFDPESAEERLLITVNADIGPPRTDEIPHVDITRDVNGDGRDDLLIPFAEGFRVFIQTAKGGFADPLKISSGRINLYKSVGYRYAPWSQSHIYEMDYNRDERIDLVYWNKDHFEVHLQKQDGFFSETNVTFTTDVVFDSDDLDTLAAPRGIQRRRKDENPEGKITGRVLHSLTDMNGDGIADLLVFSLKGGSLWKMYSTCEIYFGTPTPAGNTTFDREVDAVLWSDGIPLGLVKRDFDRDGQVDLMFTIIKPGFFKVARLLLGALLTRSVSMDIKFYQMKKGKYTKKPATIRKIKTVSLGKSEEKPAHFPAVLFGDVNGDKISDMVVQQKRKELRIFPGVLKPDLFTRRSQKIKTDLPKNKEYIWLTDINNDSKQDILIQNTEPDKPNRLTIIIVR